MIRLFRFTTACGENPDRDIGVPTVQESFERLARNPSIVGDLQEILAWAEDERAYPAELPILPFPVFA